MSASTLAAEPPAVLTTSQLDAVWIGIGEVDGLAPVQEVNQTVVPVGLPVLYDGEGYRSRQLPHRADEDYEFYQNTAAPNTYTVHGAQSVFGRDFSELHSPGTGNKIAHLAAARIQSALSSDEAGSARSVVGVRSAGIQREGSAWRGDGIAHTLFNASTNILAYGMEDGEAVSSTSKVFRWYVDRITGVAGIASAYPTSGRVTHVAGGVSKAYLDNSFLEVPNGYLTQEARLGEETSTLGTLLAAIGYVPSAYYNHGSLIMSYSNLVQGGHPGKSEADNQLKGRVRHLIGHSAITDVHPSVSLSGASSVNIYGAEPVMDFQLTERGVPQAGGGAVPILAGRSERYGALTAPGTDSLNGSRYPAVQSDGTWIVGDGSNSEEETGYSTDVLSVDGSVYITSREDTKLSKLPAALRKGLIVYDVNGRQFDRGEETVTVEPGLFVSGVWEDLDSVERYGWRRLEIDKSDALISTAGTNPTPTAVSAELAAFQTLTPKSQAAFMRLYLYDKEAHRQLWLTKNGNIQASLLIGGLGPYSVDELDITIALGLREDSRVIWDEPVKLGAATAGSFNKGASLKLDDGTVAEPVMFEIPLSNLTTKSTFSSATTVPQQLMVSVRHIPTGRHLTFGGTL